ncbi:MAG: peptide chain release factor 1 [Deltaproteobacteria bacterium]|nr:peptide chain release factor 1 [Deltaproteobacteria bacterium]
MEKLDEVEARYRQLDEQMADPAVFMDPDRVRKVGKERAELDETVSAYREYRDVAAQISDNEQLLRSDDDLHDLAQEELSRLVPRKAVLEARLFELLVPRDPLDAKDVFLEIRAGTGGEEAALFAADLFRMYCRFAERRRWTVEVVSVSETELGGLREVIAQINGDRVYSVLKYEGGVHRVQRIPTTEAQGRIHTSAVTVAVMPEADDVDVDIDEADLRIDLFRAGGAGGQHVNKTDSAVRLTHIPSGIVVVCQDERSQQKNRAKAMKVLRARLFEAAREKAETEQQEQRRSMVGTGDRSERIRTYNFPQNRLTDHRIGLTLYKLDAILEGDIEEIVSALQAYHSAQALAH